MNNEWRVRGYEWGLSRPLSPLSHEEDAEAAFAESAGRDIEAYYDQIASDDSTTTAEWQAFKRGVVDALPLFVNGEGVHFSLSQIASAIDRDVSYVKAEVAKGSLKAMSDGKWRYVAPEDFESWHKSKKWRRRNEADAK